MAEITPFRGILYSQEKIENFESVVAPPYDVISQSCQEKLYRKSDYNVVRLILGKTLESDNDQNNRYTRASKDLNDWLEKGILHQNGCERVYYYSQDYLFNGERKKRVGFVARVKLEEYSKGIIFPHEFTLSKPKEDRLKLTRACRANFSQVFGIFSDSQKTIDSLVENEVERESLSEVKDSEGVVHTFGNISNKDTIKQIAYCMKDKKVYIADGHHRYETALAYRDEMRKQSGNSVRDKPYDYVMMYLTNMDLEGTSIFPIHRLLFNLDNFLPEQLLKSLEAYFNIQSFPFENSEEKNKMRDHVFQQMKLKEKDQFSFGLYLGTGSFYLLKLKANPFVDDSTTPKEFSGIEAFILHSLIIEKIMGIKKESIKNQNCICYKKNEKEAIEMVDSGKYQIAFFLNPTRMEQVKKVAGAGLRMPQKSTFFYPKLLSGLVINPLT
ncbi:MAG: DUF1015 domain-containing protein [Nitrospinota bacterium]